MNENIDLCKEGHVIVGNDTYCQFGHPRHIPTEPKCICDNEVTHKSCPVHAPFNTQ